MKGLTGAQAVLLLGVLVVGVVLVGPSLGFNLPTQPASVFQVSGQQPTQPTQLPQSQVQCGKSATVYMNSYTGTWGEAGSKTEVYPTYTLVSDGTTIVSDSGANSTSQVSTCDTGKIYFTGASYYGNPTDFEVKTESQTVPDLEAYDVVETGDLSIVVYDDTEATALIADDNATNTVDYAGGNRGAGELYTYYAKLKINTADESFRLGGILTWYCGAEVDDFTLESNDWQTTSIPDGDLSTSFTLTDDTGANTSCSIKHAYVPTNGQFMELNEWDSIKYPFVLDTDDSNAPVANGDSYVGAVFVDNACEIDKTGVVVCDWYKHDDNGDPDDVGLNEGVVSTGFKGLTTGFAIEPQ